MKNTIKLIFGLFFIVFFLFIFTQNNFFKKVISKIKFRDYIRLSKEEEKNIYLFLETKFGNILLPNEIIFKDINKKFICKNLKFISNNIEKKIDLEFKPFENNKLIGKYSLYGKYGEFRILENEKDKINVPEIDHLSSDSSDDLNSNEFNSNEFNFDINDIIESDNEIFLQETDNVDNNDTENNTTESIINNVL